MTLSAGARRQIDLLLASQPETAPWLGVLSAVLEEAAGDSAGTPWDAVAASTVLQAERSPGTPLLAGARIPIDAPLADRWVRRLLALAAEAGPEAIGLRARPRAASRSTPGRSSRRRSMPMVPDWKPSLDPWISTPMPSLPSRRWR